MDDCIISINVCIQWALENDNPTSALFVRHDSAVILKNSLLKKQLKISSKNSSNFKNNIKIFGVHFWSCF